LKYMHMTHIYFLSNAQNHSIILNTNVRSLSRIPSRKWLSTDKKTMDSLTRSHAWLIGTILFLFFCIVSANYRKTKKIRFSIPPNNFSFKNYHLRTTSLVIVLVTVKWYSYKYISENSIYASTHCVVRFQW